MDSENNGLIRILLVEDNEHDAICFKRAFKKSSIPHDIKHLHSGEELLEVIADISDSVSAIFSDFSLPGIDGLEIFGELRARAIDKPFILMTGAGSENLALKAIKAGVSEYIIKDKEEEFLELLPLITNNTLNKYEDIIARRKAEQALRKSEQKYRSLFDGSSDAIILMNAMRFINCNQATLEMFEYSDKEEFLRVSPAELSPVKQLDGKISAFVAAEIIESAFREGRAHFEWTHRRKYGELFDADVLLTAIDSEDEGPILQATVRDITERKRIEVERENLIHDLRDALQRIKTLSGLIPICAECKNIRDDQGYWNKVEIYIENHSNAEFSHSVCPDCLQKLYPKYYKRKYGTEKAESKSKKPTVRTTR